MLPDFVIIGAKKCGTTSLYNYLALHPELSLSYEKELRFFSVNWFRGIDWYRQQFPDTTNICGEATPDYARYPFIPDVPSRIASVAPAAKLIYLVRDPIDRIVSHHLERLSIFMERRPLEAVLSTGKGRDEYLCESRYSSQIQEYLRYFPREQILVVSLEDMKKDRRTFLSRVFQFIGVNSDYWTPEFERVANSGLEKRQLGPAGSLLYPKWLYRLLRKGFVPYRVRRAYHRLMSSFTIEANRPELSPSTKDILAKQLAAEVFALEDITGIDISAWRHYSLYKQYRGSSDRV